MASELDICNLALGHLGEYRNGVREAVEKSGGAATAGGLMADADNTYQATLAAVPARREPVRARGTWRTHVIAGLVGLIAVLAIGGIALEQFAAVRATGVGSIAVVRALVAAPDPEAAAAQLLQAMAGA